MAKDQRPVRWMFATPPRPDLTGLARQLERGVLPAGHRIVKANPRRTIAIVPDVGDGVLVKHFRVQEFEALKFAVWPSRARWEFGTMETFCRLGLPTVRPIGYGERRRGGSLAEAWFLARLVPGACTVAERLAAERSLRQRLALAGRCLGLVTQLHRHPYYHRDLHTGNLLLDEHDRLVLTDMHSVLRVPRLTRALRLKNLAQLLYSMRSALDLEHAPELVRDYAHAMGESPDWWVVAIGPAIDAFEADYVAGRTKRCLRNSTLFATSRSSVGRVRRAREYPKQTLVQDLAEHARVVKQGGARFMGRAERSHVTRVAEGPQGRVVKHYRDAGLLPRLRQRLGLGRGRGAWIASRRLDVLGIATPQALALVERDDGSSVLVTRLVHPADSLRRFVSRLEVRDDPEQRRQVAEAVGYLFARLVRAGLRHADLSSKNLLLCPGPPPRPRDRRVWARPLDVHVQLIDLEGLRPMERFDWRGTVRMLAQLGDQPSWVTRTDRRRFLRAFERHAGRALGPSLLAEAAGRIQARQRRRAERTRHVAASRPVA